MLRRKRAHFILMSSWTLELGGAEGLIARSFEYLKQFPRHRFYFACNTEAEVQLMRAGGFPAILINHNCLLNEDMFKPLPGVKPIYDAVYNGRLSEQKRNDLAQDVDALALIYFHSATEGPATSFYAEHARLSALMPRANFVNKLTPEGSEWVSSEEVNKILAQSRVGLCLSLQEGAMRASMEYLLAGLSVVSTPSYGGRDYFFDDEFCIICSPDPRSVKEAVQALIQRDVPREYVRTKTLARVNAQRAKYISFVQDLIDRSKGKFQFESRFWRLTRGDGILRYRSMMEFSDTLRHSLSWPHRIAGDQFG